MSNDLLELRNNRDLNKLQSILKEVRGEVKEIDIPDTSSLNNNEVYMPEEVTGNINVHGHWCHPMYGRINNQLARGQSPIIFIVGKEGLGKSMAALEIGRRLHNDLNILRGDFNPLHQTVYSALEYIMLERSSTRTMKMLEEANETLNVNNYHSAMNTAVAGSIRTQRKRENPTVVVAPEYKQVDSRVRKKVDVMINMTGKQYAEVKAYRLNHAKRGNKGLPYKYTEYPDWAVPDVPKKLIELYDQVDNKFKGEYLDELLIKVLNERIEDIEESQTVSL